MILEAASKGETAVDGLKQIGEIDLLLAEPGFGIGQQVAQRPD
jgi:hypothetical protein